MRTARTQPGLIREAGTARFSASPRRAVAAGGIATRDLGVRTCMERHACMRGKRPVLSRARNALRPCCNAHVTAAGHCGSIAWRRGRGRVDSGLAQNWSSRPLGLSLRSTAALVDRQSKESAVSRCQRARSGQCMPYQHARGRDRARCTSLHHTSTIEERQAASRLLRSLPCITLNAEGVL